MRRTIAILLGAGLLAAPGHEAAAQQKAPTRDHAVTYRMQHEGRTAQMTVSFSASLRRQRVEMAEAGVAMIHDLPGRRMLMLNEQLRIAMELPVTAQQGQQMLSIPDDMTLARTGSATIAGHACTTYRATQRGAERGTVCLTEDGIMLRADLAQGERRGTMEATTLSLSPQPAALFEVPEGWQTMQMPSAPPGATPGAPPGGQRPPR
ncbi:MAG: DUF4412 domain-containing protein [Acetobacteraceae bacterium]|nr:DUF4412 domain-containing protein [Acetobacteraceae bacterium]